MDLRKVSMASPVGSSPAVAQRVLGLAKSGLGYLWQRAKDESLVARAVGAVFAKLLSVDKEQRRKLWCSFTSYLKWAATGGSLEIKLVRLILLAVVVRKSARFARDSDRVQYCAGRFWAMCTRVPLNLRPAEEAGVIQNTSLGLIWCDPNDKRTYKLTPSVVTGELGSIGVPQYSLAPLDATENLLAVHGGVDRAFTWISGVFVVCHCTEAGDMPVAHGYRSGNRAYLSRHVLEGPKAIPRTEGSLAILNPKTGDKKALSPDFVYDLHCGSKHVPYSGSDLASIDLPGFFWAVVGVKAISENAFRASTEGFVFMTTFGPDGAMRTSRGSLIPQTREDQLAGRIGYTISTEPGYSGSPVFQLVNGACKVVAIHMCGQIDERPANFGVCVPDVIHFRRQIGATLATELLCESKEKSPAQYNRWDDPAYLNSIFHGQRSDDEDDYGMDEEKARLAEQAEREQDEREALHQHEREIAARGDDYADFHGRDAGRRARRAKYDDEEDLSESQVQCVPVHVNKWLPDTPDRKSEGASITEEQIKKQLAAKAPDPDVVSTWDPKELLASAPFARFREYLAAGAIEWDPKETVISRDCNGEPVLMRVGKSEARSSGKSSPAKTLRQQFKDACEKFGVKMQDYIIPRDNPEAVLESLKGQLTTHCARDLKDTPQVREAFEKVVSSYEPCDEPYITGGGIHYGVDAILDSLEGDKSAGWADQYRAGKKEVWKTPEGRAIASYLVRCRILLRLAWGSVAMGCMTPKQMVREGLMDPRAPFIKREPSSVKKQKTKRWRLIWNCSVIDVLVAGITNRKQDKRDIASYQDGRAGFHCVGMGHHDDGIKAVGSILDRIAAKCGKLSSSDISGWDIGVQRDWIYLDGLRRVRLGPDSKIFRELTWCEQAATSAHVLFVGGVLYQILRAGITASGIISTSAQNSFMRSLLELIAGSEDGVSQGDDNVSSGRTNTFLEDNGVVVRDVVESGPCGPVPFTSHEFVKRAGHWFARFMNLDKMLARLELNRSGTGVPAQEAIGGCLFALRHSPVEMEQFHGVCREMGWNTDVPAMPIETLD